MCVGVICRGCKRGEHCEWPLLENMGFAPGEQCSCVCPLDSLRDEVAKAQENLREVMATPLITLEEAAEVIRGLGNGS